MRKLLILALALSACVPKTPTATPTASLTPEWTKSPSPSVTRTISPFFTPTGTLSPVPPTGTLTPTITVTPLPDGPVLLENSGQFYNTRAYLYPFLYRVTEVVTETLVYAGSATTFEIVDRLHTNDFVGGWVLSDGWLTVVTQRGIVGAVQETAVTQQEENAIVGYVNTDADVIVTSPSNPYFAAVLRLREGTFALPFLENGIYSVALQSMVNGELLSTPIDFQLDNRHSVAVVVWSGNEATPTPTKTPRPTKTATPTPIRFANGISAQYFRVDSPLSGVILFHFSITNETDNSIPIGILGVRAIRGGVPLQTQPSWSAFQLGPHQNIEWSDHIDLTAGEYNLRLGICLVENIQLWQNCFAGGNWTYYLQKEKVVIP